MRKIYIIGSMAFLFAACKPSVNINTPATPGKADFSNYLAVGNSLTAGYSDNSLTVSGQLNSYPERLFEQFQKIPGAKGAKGPFIQPLLASDNGYPGPKKVLAITYSACIPNDSSLSAIDFPNYIPTTADNTYSATVNNGQVNNIGVPGIRIADYAVGQYAGANPYAARFYHNLAGTPMDELNYRVNNLNPTFFTFWLGANDVLGYATSGGQGDGSGNAAPLFSSFYSSGDITPTAVFEKLYDSALQVVTHTGALGALINIPDVTSIPFFTTVPANGLTLTRQGQADTLQRLYSNLRAVFQVGANYFIIQDHAGQTRQAVPGELILLTIPQDSLTCAGWGVKKPIPARYVLTTDEIQNVRNAVSTFNSFIQTEAFLYNLAYVDMNAYLQHVASGITFNGVAYNAQYATGGAFSLDGVHLTQRGYALIANQIITTINAKYKSTIQMIDINKYNGVSFPK